MLLQFILTPSNRDTIVREVLAASPGSVLTIRGPKRTDVQNRRLHGMIRDVSRQVKHNGMSLSEDDWRILFVDALRRETRVVQNLDGNGLVALSRSTANLSVKECADLITIIQAYGDQHNVQFKADQILEDSYGSR